ncbi:MAG: hypothetical protein KR126chlam6_00099, partial [Candidatus Anoxychlamydiales bacterium]|nr:hypothetical protein [Candidatus Anoxychlamydiales bacterium]
IAIAIGLDKAKNMFLEEIKKTKDLLKILNLDSAEFFTLIDILEKKISKF